MKAQRDEKELGCNGRFTVISVTGVYSLSVTDATKHCTPSTLLCSLLEAGRARKLTDVNTEIAESRVKKAI